MDQTLERTRDRMRKTIEVVRNDLTSIRSGRANPAIIENLSISAYGGSGRFKLRELATITTSDNRTLLVAPFDPSIAAEVEKGILEANIGLTPVREGDMIRLSVPELSEERRLEYLKLAKTKLEHGRVMVRQVRADAMKDLKRAEEEKTISEDERKHGEKLIQELTDEMIAEIDTLGARKEQELMTL